MAAQPLSWAARAGGAAFGAFALMSLAAAPARAQFFGYFFSQPPAPRALPGSTVDRLLIRRGLRLIGPLERNGGVFLADVRDRYGRRRRLVIDAYTGSILQIFAYGPPRPPASIPGGAAYAYRYVPAPAPNEGLRMAPAPEPGRPIHPKRPVRKLARREAPATRSVKGGAALPPAPSRPLESSAPAASEAKKPSQSAGAPKHEPAAAATNAREEARAAAPAPAPAKAAAKPAGATAKKPSPTGPGYANGVPINPLD